MTSRLDVLHPDPKIRTEAQNTLRDSYEWNKERIAHSEKEFSQPIRGIWKSVRDGVLGVLGSAGILATDLVTRPLAAVANAGRWVLDATTKLPARMAVIGSDMLSEGTFGRVSRWIRSFREKIHNTISGNPSGAHGADAHALDAHSKKSGDGGHAKPAHGH